METAILLWFLAFALIVTGLVGLVLPAIPGALLVFAGLLLAAWAEDFTYVGTWTIVALAVLTLLSYGVDFWATMFGAKKFGASKGAILGAVIGSMVGIFLGFPGVLFRTHSPALTMIAWPAETSWTALRVSTCN